MLEFEARLKACFLEEAEELLRDCEQHFLELEKNPHDETVIEKIFRLAHSFKGSAGAVGFEDLMTFAHHLESLLVKIKNGQIIPNKDLVNLLLKANDQLHVMVSSLKENSEQRFNNDDLNNEIAGFCHAKIAQPEPSSGTFAESDDDRDLNDVYKNQAAEAFDINQISQKKQKALSNSAADESIRVNLKRIDTLVNDVGELVILQTVLFQQRHSIPSPLLQKTITHLEKISRQIQSTSMSLRMVPLRQTIQKMQRIVRDVAQTLNKDVNFITTGEETEIDKTILDLLADPLVHLVRNAVDHGIETREVRQAAHKAEIGTIHLRAYHRGEHIVIEIEDDGQGLNTEKLIETAVARSIIPAGTEVSAAEAHRFIFASGFSTKREVTSISGRGIGMDVVKTHVDQLQGQIEIESTPGRGTCFRILLPLTLAIIDGMIVTSNEHRYVIPIASIVESLQPNPVDISHVAGHGTFLNVRGQTIQLCRLADILDLRKPPSQDPGNSIAIVGKTQKNLPFAILVDDILGQQQVVIKKLGDELQNITGVSGAAILGDGKAALIIDMPDLVQAFLSRTNRQLKRKEAA